MTAGGFATGILRLTAILAPLLFSAHVIRTRAVRVTGAVAALCEAVLALSLLLVGAEALGLFGADRPAALIALFVLLALLTGGVRRGRATVPRRAPPGPGEAQRPQTAPPEDPEGATTTRIAATLAVVVVAAQWCLQTANALGSGMYNFDTLWYHMPFAARFAQTGSVTGIQFTQADPFVAYYPANSELLHAVGIIALRNDFLSPLLNLMWLALALLAAWCLGRPWRVARLTLIAGCLVAALPVLSSTQPGEAFNDTAGLAMLLAGAAIAANAPRQPRMLALAGLALGFACGTKYTFIVPVAVVVVGMALCADRGRRFRALLALLAPAALTGGLWYARNLIDVGNPLGSRLHLGPLVLPGPESPLASASEQTVAGELGHLAVWGSRFAPGLAHAIGPLWPLVLALYLLGVLAGLWLGLSGERLVGVLALSAALVGISYLFLPTGASGLQQGSLLFQVNLRYATPALALGIALVPIVTRLRAPRRLMALGPGLLLILLATQLRRALWLTQTLRHLAFLLAAGAIAAVAWRARGMRPRLAASWVALGCGGLIALALVAFAAQRHYFDRRYLIGDARDPALGSIYRWAQGVSHSRIALYGTVEQYPLYGAADTNRVDYLGEAAPDGGYRPIATCAAWRTALRRGRYRYVVLTPGPTAGIPLAWTRTDPAMQIVLQPAPAYDVFEVRGSPDPSACPG